MVILESQVIKDIRQKLSIWQLTGEIVYWSRMQSGTVRVNDKFIKMCEAGTPDFICIIRNKENNLSLLWIEAKRPDGKGRLSDIQKGFRDKYKNFKDVYHCTITNVSDLIKLIDELAIDRLKDITI